MTKQCCRDIIVPQAADNTPSGPVDEKGGDTAAAAAAPPAAGPTWARRPRFGAGGRSPRLEGSHDASELSLLEDRCICSGAVPNPAYSLFWPTSTYALTRLPTPQVGVSTDPERRVAKHTYT